MKGVAVFVLLVCMYLVAVQAEESASVCYGSVIDAGSSGSRAYIFKWDCRTKKQLPDVDITQDAVSKKLNGGIATYINNLEAVKTQVAGLAKFVTDTVPDDQEFYTPIYFRATAGMRLLSETDQNSILNVVRQTLKNTTLLFEDSWASVLSGEHEGVYGWFTVNYVQHLLSKTVSATSTRAAVDLGGASVQLTFVPTDPTTGNVPIVLEGIATYRVYTHSYLGYGNDKARESAALMASTSSGGVVHSPCYNQGYNKTGVASYDTSLVVQGTGNATLCRDQIVSFLNVTNACGKNRCSINGVYQPPVPASMGVNGFSAIAYAKTMLQFPTNTTIQEILDKSIYFCELEWDNVTQMAGYDSFSGTYCFVGLYFAELLHTGFGLPLDTKLTISNTIGPMSINWALGSLAYDVANLPCKLNTEACAAVSSGLTSVSAAPAVHVSFIGILLFVISMITMSKLLH